jgi:hypothetical protein
VVKRLRSTALLAAAAVVAASPGPGGPPDAYRLRVRGQYQDTPFYCVPAAGSMSLATFGVAATQGVLARQMATTRARGTTGDSAARVIDGYIRPRRYDDSIVGDVVGRPAVLMRRISYDVGALHRAPIMQVWMELLPWNRGKIKARRVGHAIIAYGYDRGRGTITVFDPWRPTGGPHTLSAAVLATALQGGSGMHFFSRM